MAKEEMRTPGFRLIWPVLRAALLTEVIFQEYTGCTVQK